MNAVKGPAFCRSSTSKIRSASGVDGGEEWVTSLDCITQPLRDSSSCDFQPLGWEPGPEKKDPTRLTGLWRPDLSAREIMTALDPDRIGAVQPERLEA